jgi:hypothetical protein
MRTVYRRNRSDPSYPVLVIGPKELPQAATDEATADFWIDEIQIINDTDSAVTISVYDRQDPPIAFIPRQQLGPGAMISGVSRVGRYMPGGITWSASGPGISGYIAGSS